MKNIYNTIVKMLTKVPYQNRFRTIILVILIVSMLVSCKDFVQIDPPDSEIVQEMVFTSDDVALSAIDAVYHNLQYSGFSSGRTNSITILCAATADILKSFNTNPFYENVITSDNATILSLWSSLYQRIYEVNAILEGIESSSSLSETVRKQLQGEAKFIRAFSYFYLVNLYGRVPLITATEYQSNAVMPQSDPSEIYKQIVADLTDSETLLDNDYHGDLRTRVNKGTVRAMLARVYLFMENWEQAERYATMVINDPLYTLLPDLDQVFLKESTETIWHLLPVDSRYNTWEGYYLILEQVPNSQFSTSLTDSFMASLEEPDLRKTHWIGEVEGISDTYYYPYKYKVKLDSNLSEYSVVFRLAEQYLIRAEARAMQSNLTNAITDLDAIKERADLPLIADTHPGIDREELLAAIWEERKKELFAEWGHRWLDIKRTGNIDAVLSEEKPNWQSYQAMFPIPQHEYLNNPNLEPTDGYAY
ncbi:RagB/SusD family nutrient uptake outer membrane protein [Sinomicrobium soli]|uniref:RagB/SusD family nutrient uptake outer membrane protein n=1 Tax=Sinomicrobium sp. N-1-3-6 TaxID=2219864 RepID=UPI000DCC3831|nr:RagB/SusD family nutrient uptake outer membrane protein [Sinomicrobium sp. N-1-3-6]RAV30417.1 RagB/SusD family nutrient uptake outer membrane protein [Sinomicrobium sp. N-1-3-6]